MLRFLSSRAIHNAYPFCHDVAKTYGSPLLIHIELHRCSMDKREIDISMPSRKTSADRNIEFFKIWIQHLLHGFKIEVVTYIDKFSKNDSFYP